MKSAREVIKKQSEMSWKQLSYVILSLKRMGMSPKAAITVLYDIFIKDEK